MIYPDVEPKKWAERYGLEIVERPCPKCSKLLVPTIPFATTEWRGMRSVTHDCGPEYDLKILVVADPHERAEWDNCVSQLYEMMPVESSEN